MNNWTYPPTLSGKKGKSQIYVNAHKSRKITLKKPFVNNVGMSKQLHSKVSSKLVSNILYFAKLSFKIHVILFNIAIVKSDLYSMCVLNGRTI